MKKSLISIIVVVLVLFVVLILLKALRPVKEDTSINQETHVIPDSTDLKSFDKRNDPPISPVYPSEN